MSIARLEQIPGISVKTLNDFIRVTADDGLFSLSLARIDTMNGSFWRFDHASTTVTRVAHFHLRYLIDRALNS